MLSRATRLKLSRYTAAFALALILLVDLFLLHAFAAKPSTSSPANNKLIQSHQQEDIQENGPTSPQEKTPTSGRQSTDRRSPLANSPVINEFQEWVEQFKLGGTVSASEQRGRELAERRRSVMVKLIEADPGSAVELAVPAQVRQKMPADIQQNVEEQVSGYGDYLVRIYDYADPQTGEFTRSRTERKVVINGKTYDASVYGHKVGMTTKLNIPLRGVVMDGVIALAESPVRVLDDEERDFSAGAQGVDVEVGGKVQRFDNQEQVEQLKEKLKKRELTIGPNSAAKSDATNATKGMDMEASASETNAATPAQSAWTEGAKTVLFMRVDFSDKSGEPVDANGSVLTLARAQSLINTECNNFYKNNSYNKTSLAGTVTKVLRLPQTAAYYGAANDPFQLLFDARAAAKAAGYDTAGFHLDIVAFTRINEFGWAGLGYIGGKGSWLNGYFSLRESSHELGHNLGLNHANLWKTSDRTVVGTGSSVEYADPFDAMGGGNTTSTHHFNAWFKNLLNWLPTASVLNVAASGTYRIQPYDLLTSTGRRALKIQRDVYTYYWVEFRQAMPESSFVSNGALIRWGYTTNQQSNLLDMTPTTASGASDSPLAVGQTFTDARNGIKITATGKTTTSPAELDVTVTYTTNLNTLTINPTTVVGGNTISGTVTLNAPAPTMGAEIRLSDNLAATTVPQTVFIQSGAKSETFTIPTKAVTANQTGTLTASYRGVVKTSPLTVQPIALSAFTLNKTSIGGGGTVIGTVTLNSPAPASGTVVTLSDNIAAANTPPSVTVPAGAKTQTFSITTATVTANQSGNVTASCGGVTKSLPLVVAPIALEAVIVFPASVAGGVNVACAVRLNGPAPASGAVVTLSDNIPATTLPASVTVAAGESQSKTFNITTTIVDATQTGQVSGKYQNVTKMATLTIRPTALASITLAPVSVAGGNNVTGTVSLDGPAPSGGAVITLSDNLTTASTPANVSIPAGAKSATFTITTSEVTAKQTGAVTASRGSVTKTAALTVRPVGVQSITVKPNPIAGGTTATGTIVLERPSSTSTVVTLSDNLPATTIPQSVTVPAGALSQTFQITTTITLTSQTGVLSATANAETRTVTIKVVNTQSQLILNTGFESGPVNWVVSSPDGDSKVIHHSPEGPSRSGQWAAWLGGYTTPVTESLYQQVTIPANAVSADFNFYLWLFTQDSTPVPADTLQVQIRDTNGTVLGTLSTYSNLDNTPWYIKQTFSLLDYKGQTVRVFFLSNTNPTAVTWFFIDDVTLDVIQ